MEQPDFQSSTIHAEATYRGPSTLEAHIVDSAFPGKLAVNRQARSIPKSPQKTEKPTKNRKPTKTGKPG